MAKKPEIHVKRAYEDAESGDGRRILVDRMWPRGVKKEDAAIDHWAKEAAPSTELRKWYGHDPEKWDEFRRRYFAELDENSEAVAELREAVGDGPATLVFSSKEERYNNAVALKEYLEGRG